MSGSKSPSSAETRKHRIKTYSILTHQQQKTYIAEPKQIIGLLSVVVEPIFLIKYLASVAGTIDIYGNEIYIKILTFKLQTHRVISSLRFAGSLE